MLYEFIQYITLHYSTFYNILKGGDYAGIDDRDVGIDDRDMLESMIGICWNR